MVRCMAPKGSHRTHGGAPIAVRIASSVPIAILIHCSSRTRRSRLIVGRARVLAGPDGRVGLKDGRQNSPQPNAG